MFSFKFNFIFIFIFRNYKSKILKQEQDIVTLQADLQISRKEIEQLRDEKNKIENKMASLKRSNTELEKKAKDRFSSIFGVPKILTQTSLLDATSFILFYFILFYFILFYFIFIFTFFSPIFIMK